MKRTRPALAPSLQVRASTIAFSDKACVRVEDGRFFLQFQVVDMRPYAALVESHVRLYAVRIGDVDQAWLADIADKLASTS